MDTLVSDNPEKKDGLNETPKIRKAVLRTIRLEADIDRGLQMEADKRGGSLNAYIGMILKKHIEFDVPAEMMNCLSYPHQSFKELIDIVDDEKITKIGQENGERLGSVISIWYGKSPTLQSYLNFCSVWGKHSNIFNFSSRLDGRDLNLGFEHELGMKWSIFLENTMTAAFKDLFEHSCEFKRNDRSLVIRLRLPSHQVDSLR